MFSIIGLCVCVKFLFSGQWDCWIWWFEFVFLVILSKIIVQLCNSYLQIIRVLAHYLCTSLHLLGYSLEGEGQKDLTNVDGYLDSIKGSFWNRERDTTGFYTYSLEALFFEFCTFGCGLLFGIQSFLFFLLLFPCPVFFLYLFSILCC
jgi:hypothetical protein